VTGDETLPAPDRRIFARALGYPQAGSDAHNKHL
jgi:hypothetical protein